MTQFVSATWDGALKVTSPFGAMESFRKIRHTGVDIVSPGPCYAPFAGRVIRSIADGNNGDLGKVVRIVSDDGRFVFTVCHLNSNSDTGLRTGARVAARQKLANDMGRPPTGFVTGPHYHEMLTDNGRLVNLLDYLGKSFGGGSGSSAAPIQSGWDGKSTDFKGEMGIKEGQDYYTLGPAGAGYLDSPGAVAAKYGIDLGTVLSWTNAAFPNQGFHANGIYYSGFKVAIVDIVAKQKAEQEKVAALAAAQESAAKEAAEIATEAAQIAADSRVEEGEDKAKAESTVSSQAEAIAKEIAYAEKARRKAIADARKARKEALQNLESWRIGIEAVLENPVVEAGINETYKGLSNKSRKIVYNVGVWLGVAAAAGTSVASVLTGDYQLFVAAGASIALSLSNALAKANINDSESDV